MVSSSRDAGYGGRAEATLNISEAPDLISLTSLNASRNSRLC